MKFTITEFRKLYPNDSACLDKLFRLRFSDITNCPSCHKKFNYRRITTRRSYQCKYCYFQLYPTAGTPFEKTRTPLTFWFYSIYLMTATRNGVSAKELERQLGVTYKTAFRMAHKIRELMSKSKSKKLSSFVEIDETYVGGAHKGKRGRGSENKAIVFGMVERAGNVKALSVTDTKRETLYPLIKKHVEQNSNISSDEYPVYREVKKLGFEHRIIKHKEDVYVDGSISTNTIEGYFGQLKRMISGTHIHVSHKYLQNYVDESVFKYNNRESETPMFNKALENVCG